MKRRLLIVLFGFGTIAGFGSAGAHWSRHHHRHRQAFEAHVARVCVDAARAATEARPAPPPPEARPEPPPQRECPHDGRRRHHRPRHPHR
ncbi:MAG: hypothetical protein JJ863_21060 [Deltaproteobacteria bacterium]|nr:hypothetical protein [Deltaproteobacteria bacterium]